jgi:hemerythrin
MAIIVWRDEYSVGIQKIDEQHKMLFNLVNDLHNAMIDGTGKDHLGTTLNKLLVYTELHFKMEENYMEATHYPGYLTHKKEHDAFKAKTLELQQEFRSGSVGLTISTMNFLRDWLTDHILGTDQKYSAYFVSKGIK